MARAQGSRRSPASKAVTKRTPAGVGAADEVSDRELRDAAREARQAMKGLGDLTLPAAPSEADRERFVLEWWREQVGALPRAAVRDPLMRPLRSGGPLVRLLHAEFGSDAAATAFIASSGGDRYRPRHEQLRAVKSIAHALESVLVAGTAEEWAHIAALREVVATLAIRRLAVVRVVHDGARALERLGLRDEWLASKGDRSDSDERSGVAREVRRQLVEIDANFGTLEPPLIVAQLARINFKGKSTGRGHVGVPRIAAELSVACHAFGDGSKTSLSVAIEDASASFRAASTRAFGSKGVRDT